MRRAISTNIDEAVKSTQDNAEKVLNLKAVDVEPNWKEMLSTGSTLLDLALTGGRVYGGGVPGGILMEVYGRSGSGKTSILSELGGAAQAKGGEVMFLDTEARLDEGYARTYGLSIPKESYHRPNTVTEMFSLMGGWDPDPKNLNVLAADSLAALSTELELEKGDKMGMRRAKEFSEGLRKYCRLISKMNWLVACSNQVRQGDFGDVTPGGKAIEFYASARISVNMKGKVEKVKKVGKKDITKPIGIYSECVVTKSSIDKPYRTAPIYIIFDYGLDDIRANLQWNKDMKADTSYNALDKTYVGMDAAINYIEENELEDKLKNETIALWAEIEAKFKIDRKKKNRG